MSKHNVWKNWKRRLAAVLALAMALTLLPVSVMAEDGTGAPPEVVEPTDTTDPTDTEEPLVEAAAEGAPATIDATGTAGSVKFSPSATMTGNVKLAYSVESTQIAAEVCAVGSNGAVAFHFESAEAVPSYYKIQPLDGEFGDQQEASVSDAVVTISGLKQRDVVLFYDDTDNYAAVRVIFSAQVNVDVVDEASGDAVTASEAEDGDFLANDLEEDDGNILTSGGTEANVTDINGYVFDIAKSLDEQHPGDKLTFKVEPGEGRKASVSYDEETVTTPLVITADTEDKTFAVTLSESKVYDINITFADEEEVTELTTITSVTVTVANSGTVTVGDKLTAQAKDSGGNNISADVDYKWQVSANGTDGWTDIDGATAAEYTVASTDVNKYLRAVATGKGTTVAATPKESSATAKVAAAGIAPVAPTGVTISGTPALGQTLTAEVAPAGATVTGYKWYRDTDTDTATAGTEIAGATASTYKLVQEDVGKYIYVTVTDGTTTKTSTATPVVTAPAVPTFLFSGLTPETYALPVQLSAESEWDMDIYYVTSEDNDVTLTFAGQATGEIESEKTADATVDTTQYASNKVTIGGYSDRETVTLTRQGADFRIRFYQVAKVAMKLADGSGSMGTADYAFTAENPDNEDNGGTLNASKTSHTELLDDGDDVTLTVKANAGNRIKSVMNGAEALTATSAGVYTLSDVEVGEIYDIVVTFEASPPDTTPNEAVGKEGNLSLTENKTSSPAIFSYSGTNVAYEMYVAGALEDLAFPGLPSEGVKYMIAEDDSAWGAETPYTGSIASLSERDIILFYTDAGNWLKVRVMSSALVKVNVVGGDTDNTVNVKYTSAANSNNNAEFTWGADFAPEWLDIADSGETVTLTVKGAKPSAVTLNGKTVTGAESVFTTNLTAAQVYDFVVSFADSTLTDTSEETTIGGTVLVDGSGSNGAVAVEIGTEEGQVSLKDGGVNFVIPSDTTLTVTGTIDKPLAVSGGGKIAVDNVSVSAEQPVTVKGSELTVKEAMTVSDGGNLTVQDAGGKVIVSESLTLGSEAGTQATASVTNGGALEVSGDVTVKNAALSVDSGATIDVKENGSVAVSPGSTLTVGDRGTVAVAGNAKLDITGGTLDIAPAAKVTLAAGSAINVPSGAMTIQKGAEVTASGAATITVGGTPQARMLRAALDLNAATGTTPEATLTVSENWEIGANLSVSVKGTGAMIIEEGVTVSLKSALKNDGFIILMPKAALDVGGGSLISETVQGGKVIDQNGLTITISVDDKYIARDTVTLNVGSENALSSTVISRTLTFTGLTKGDWLYFKTTATVGGQQAVSGFLEDVNPEDDGSFSKDIVYGGAGGDVAIVIYGGKPNLSNPDAIGAPMLADNSESGQ